MVDMEMAVMVAEGEVAMEDEGEGEVEDSEEGVEALEADGEGHKYWRPHVSKISGVSGNEFII